MKPDMQQQVIGQRFAPPKAVWAKGTYTQTQQGLRSEAVTDPLWVAILVNIA
jgi:hypothetical protein